MIPEQLVQLCQAHGHIRHARPQLYVQITVEFRRRRLLDVLSQHSHFQRVFLALVHLGLETDGHVVQPQRGDGKQTHQRDAHKLSAPVAPGKEEFDANGRERSVPVRFPEISLQQFSGVFESQHLRVVAGEQRTFDGLLERNDLDLGFVHRAGLLLSFLRFFRRTLLRRLLLLRLR